MDDWVCGGLFVRWLAKCAVVSTIFEVAKQSRLHVCAVGIGCNVWGTAVVPATSSTTAVFCMGESLGSIFLSYIFLVGISQSDWALYIGYGVRKRFLEELEKIA
jgi:hypothetical protein